MIVVAATNGGGGCGLAVVDGSQCERAWQRKRDFCSFSVCVCVFLRYKDKITHHK